MNVFNDIFKNVDDLLNWFIKWLYYINLFNGYIILIYYFNLFYNLRYKLYDKL